MAFRLSANGQNKECAGLVGAIDAGTTNTAGQLLVYTGSQPATPDTAATGTLLVTIPFNNPSFGAPASGTASLVVSPAVSGSCVAAGTPGWCRVQDRNGNAVFDGSISATGGGGDITFDNTSFVVNGVVSITSLSVGCPM